MIGIPDSQKSLQDLQPITPLFYSAFEAATQNVKEFFEREAKQIDNWLAPCLVRYYAKGFLRNAGQDIDDEPYDLDDSLSNNGLCLSYGNYQIRIWKTSDGHLPVPGPSQVRQAFFNQQLSLGFPLPVGKINLAILWSASASYGLAGLALSCPRGGKETRASVQEYWSVPIPHPALSAMIPITDSSEILDDLDISRRVDVDEAEARQ